ncbi:MAG: ribosome maturation factor RimM [Chitinophagales bacterium]|nr:ribosome maturation factor RimM [Chitinophagales bacterium]
MDNLVEIGSIYKAHGVKGLMKVFIQPDLLEDIFELDAVFIREKSGITPYFIEAIEDIADDMILLKLEGVNSKEDVSSLIKCPLLTSKDNVNIESEDETSLIGFLVIDKTNGEIGKIKEILSYPSQDMLQVQYKDKEILIPMHEDLVVEQNMDKHQIIFDLPDGFLEIF